MDSTDKMREDFEKYWLDNLKRTAFGKMYHDAVRVEADSAWQAAHATIVPLLKETVGEIKAICFTSSSEFRKELGTQLIAKLNAAIGG